MTAAPSQPDRRPAPAPLSLRGLAAHIAFALVLCLAR